MKDNIASLSDQLARAEAVMIGAGDAAEALRELAQ